MIRDQKLEKKVLFIVISAAKYNLIIAFIAGTIFLFLCPAIFAAENKKIDNPVAIESERMEYNNVSDVYDFQGNVVIKYGDGTLKADNVQFDNKNNIATAQGNAFLSMGADNMAGDKIGVKTIVNIL